VNESIKPPANKKRRTPAAQLLALSEELGARLQARALRVVTAESCTAGGVAYAITQVPGSSAWLDRGFVVYSNLAKQEQLGVAAQTLADYGAVSQPVARAMALGALEHSSAQLALAITGIAGPGGGTADKPVGTVCFAWALRPATAAAPGAALGAATDIRTLTCRFDGDRAAVRTQSIEQALRGAIAVVDQTEA